MHVTVTLPGGSTDDLNSLHTYLAAEFDLRGNVTRRESPPPPGSLGGLADALIVTLGQGGVGAVLASAAVAWVRTRTTDLVCKISRPDGTVTELSAKRLRDCDVAALQEVVRELSSSLEAGPDQTNIDQAP